MMMGYGRYVGGGIGLVLILSAFLVHASLEAPLYVFEKDLSYGMRGTDVEKLQAFLKDDKNIYPEGIVSGWFGPLTRRAVIRFQEKYAAEILIPLGLQRGTGFTGPATRSILNSLLYSSAVGSKSISPTSPKISTPQSSAGPDSSTTSPPAAGSTVGLGGGGQASSNGAAAQPRVKILDPGASHRCEVEPFGVGVRRGSTAAARILLTPSVPGRPFRIQVGDLPLGLMVTPEPAQGGAVHEVQVRFWAGISAPLGSFNAIFIYEEVTGDGSSRRNFCQANVTIDTN